MEILGVSLLKRATMHTNRLKTFLISVLVVAGLVGFFWFEAAPKRAWFKLLLEDPRTSKWKVIPGTEVSYSDLGNPWTWSGYIGQVWLAPANYHKDDVEGVGGHRPIGIPLGSISEEMREVSSFWFLFSSDRSASKIVPMSGTDPDELMKLLRAGDGQFAGKKEPHHDAVLKYIRSM